MARRFNLDMDMDLALEGIGLESSFAQGLESSQLFINASIPMVKPQTLFSETYTLMSPFNVAVSSSLADETLEAPLPPGQHLDNGPFVAAFELSALLATNGGDGSLGFVINGLGALEFSGWSVSGIGDVNNDGVDDFAIGAALGDSTGNGIETGETYVIFGQLTGFAPEIDLLSLDGTNGFIITGTDNDGRSGLKLSAVGDINGDGVDDILLADERSDVSGYDSGQSFVVFGSDTGFDPYLSLQDLDGTNGFTINGLTARDKFGIAISGNGDINGDGFDDIIIGADNGDNGNFNAGETYVIFGSDTGFSNTLDLSSLDGTNGYVINGIDIRDYSGRSVDFAGDINGDGFDDILIGAPYGDINGTSTGEVYLVYGSAAGFGGAFDLSSLLAANGGDGSAGFIIGGQTSNDYAGRAVSSAGDINGDGFDDILIGVTSASPNGFRSGQSYVVFGSDASFGATFDLSSLDGTNGFAINGINGGDRSGHAVSTAGDFNGDGFDDILVNAINASPNGDDSGQSYIIFGSNSGFTPVLELSDIDGSNGFVINGIQTDDLAGRVLAAAGDINGDGFDDIILGTTNASPNGALSGQSYVIFGAASIETPAPATEIELADILTVNGGDGSLGFVLNGVSESDLAGDSVSDIGDFNGDGFDDIIIGAFQSDPNGDVSGASYIVFGSNMGFPAELELASLNGTNGFVLNGIDAIDFSGRSVSSAGDINGDGFDDVLIGASSADPNGSSSGESYVVFGSAASFGPSFELSSLNGTNGFVLNGIDSSDSSGEAVSAAGDINGDGFDDILISARSADPNGNSGAGETYVVYGSANGFSASFELSSLMSVNGGDGSAGFIINGIDTGDASGHSVSSAGDINGDGFDDILIGAINGDGDNGYYTSNRGEAYVVYGSQSGFGAELNLSSLNGANGFVLTGIDGGDNSGRSVSSAGDINSDGFDDIIIGAPYSNPYGERSGEAYVVFGSDQGFAASVDLSILDGSNGFLINGASEYALTGFSVSSAGDINGDGLDDIIVGARGTISADTGDATSSQSFVIFGRNDGFSSIVNLSALSQNDGLVINGIGYDNSGISVSSAGDINSDGYDDLLIGARFSNPNGSGSGAAYIIYGQAEFGRIVETLSATDDIYTASNDGEVVFALAGDDVINGGTASDIIFGDEGDDVINGLGGNDTINGGDGRDILRGGDGDDTLNGDAGNDDFYGGAGADVMNGGAGADRVFYSLATAGVTANFIDQSLNTGEAAGDTYNSIESITGSNFDDVITSGGDNNDLVGLGGNDVLNGAGGRDRLFGGNGDDRLLGGLGNDDLHGQGGADTYVIQSGAGADRIFTYEAGIDLIQYIGGPGDMADLTIEQVGANTRITSIVGVLTLMGIDAITITAADFSFVNPLADPTGITVTTDLTSGNDIFTGDENDDVVNGLAGNDTIRGGIGDDTLNGGDGNDLLTGGLGADVLNGGAGIDRVLYSTASTGVTINVLNPLLNTGEAAGDTYISIENFSGSNGNDNITSGNDGNQLIGLGGNDVLIGAGGNDTLFGGDDDDRLVGGADNDVLFGQAGADTFVFFAGAGNDTIRDFEDGVDIIEFRDTVDSFADLVISQNGANAVITSANGVITLTDFDSTLLDAADFTFV